MTIEPTIPKAVYTIASAGPFALRDSGGNPWPYTAGGVAVAVVKAGVLTALVENTDFTLSPASGADGNLTLSTAALAAHTGGQLIITRQTVVEQGWQGVQGAREVSLAMQLDQFAMTLQEHGVALSGAFQLAAGGLPPIVLTSGRALMYEDGKIVSGPTADEIANAQGYAEDAQAAAAQVNLGALEQAVAQTAADRLAASISATAASTSVGSATAAAATAQAAAGSAQASALTYATWSALSGRTADMVGQGAEVLDTDTGTHVDPTNGQTVPNAGRYTWVAVFSGGVSGWQRIGATVVSGKADKATTENFVNRRVVMSGTGGVWTGVSTPALTSYVAGLRIMFRATETISGQAVTLNIDGLGVKPIQSMFGNSTSQLSFVSGAEYELHMLTTAAWRVEGPMLAPASQMVKGTSAIRTYTDPAGVAAMVGIGANNRKLLGVGDSITYNTYETSLLAYFAALGTPVLMENKSHSGRKSPAIAHLYGAANQTIAFTGNQIPASGGVVLTHIMGGTAGADNFDPLGGYGQSAYNVKITVGGQIVAGVLDVAGDTYTFTRATSGSIIDTAGGATISYDFAEDAIAEGRIPILCVGRNNISDPDTVRRDILAILRRFPSGLKRSLGLVVPTFPNTTTGAAVAADLERVARAKADLIAIMGQERVLDWPEYMRLYGLQRLDLTPTANDLADIAAGLIPRQLRREANDGHLNETGNDLLGVLIAERLDALGWV